MLNVAKNRAPHMSTCTPPEKPQCDTKVCIPTESREVFSAGIKGKGIKTQLQHSFSVLVHV